MAYGVVILQSPKSGKEKGTPKNFCCYKEFAELSGELSGAICLKTLVLMGHDRQPPRIVQKILWRCSCDLLALGFFFWLPTKDQS